MNRIGSIQSLSSFASFDETCYKISDKYFGNVDEEFGLWLQWDESLLRNAKNREEWPEICTFTVHSTAGLLTFQSSSSFEHFIFQVMAFMKNLRAISPKIPHNYRCKQELLKSKVQTGSTLSKNHQTRCQPTNN